MDMKVIPVVIGAVGINPKDLIKGLEDLFSDFYQRSSGDYPNRSIIKIGQNTEKSPGDLRRIAVT